jgi:hypothetical protein
VNTEVMILSITAHIIMIDMYDFVFARGINSLPTKCVMEHIKAHPVLVCTPARHHINSKEIMRADTRISTTKF